MISRFMLATVAATLAVVCASDLMAQSNGKGLNRGLGSLARANGAGNAGGKPNIARARASGNLARAVGNGKSSSALSRSSARPVQNRQTDSKNGTAETAATSQEQVLKQRLQQADHLRAISERNGNERLIETADRMESSAVRNFERQSGTIIEQPAGAVDPAAPALEAPSLQRTPSKGFWFRSR